MGIGGSGKGKGFNGSRSGYAGDDESSHVPMRDRSRTPRRDGGAGAGKGDKRVKVNPLCMDAIFEKMSKYNILEAEKKIQRVFEKYLKGASFQTWKDHVGLVPKSLSATDLETEAEEQLLNGPSPPPGSRDLPWTSSKPTYASRFEIDDD